MLLGFVLPALLVAQAGEFPVVHVSGLGLARGASTEGAHGFGGLFGRDAAGQFQHVTAGGADHHRTLRANSVAARRHKAMNANSSLSSLSTLPAFQFAQVGRAQQAPRSLAEPQRGCHVLIVDAAVVMTTAVSGAISGEDSGCGAVHYGADGLTILRYSDPGAERGFSLGNGLGHGVFLSREIPPVPGPLGSGRGERSLAPDVHMFDTDRLNAPNQRVLTVPVLEGLVLLATVGEVDARHRKVAAERADKRGGRFALMAVAVGVCVVASGGVDVFHDQRIAQPLAHVNQNIRAIFALASA